MLRSTKVFFGLGALMLFTDCRSRGSRVKISETRIDERQGGHDPSIPRYDNAGRADDHSAATWGYETKEDITGPDRWPGTCASNARQSPIKLRSPEVFISHPGHDGRDQLRNNETDLKIEWPEGKVNFEVFNNRHAVQANIARSEPDAKVEFMDETYILRQFHYHKPSEHFLNDTQYPFEIHFVHENERESGKFLVIGVFVTWDEEGSPLKEQLNKFVSQKPIEGRTEQSRFEKTPVSLELRKMIPFAHLRQNGTYTDAFFSYQGSLTTPPCTESVTWVVLKKAVGISKQEAGAIARAKFNFQFDNSRPAREPNENEDGHGLSYFPAVEGSRDEL